MESNLVLYVDDMFHPSIDERVVDRLLQNPNSISFRYFEMTGVARETLSKLRNALLDHNSDKAPNITLAIAKQLVSFVRTLPKWMQRTRLISSLAIAVRDILLNPSDPNTMLFEDIPNACGVSLEMDNTAAGKRLKNTGQSTDQYVDQLTKGLTELRTAYVSKLEDIHQLLLKSLKVTNVDNALSTVLHTRAKAIHGLTGDLRLDGFATHLSEYSQTTEWLERVAGFAAKKPCRDWIDSDLNIASLEISDLCTRFQRAEALIETMGRPIGAEALTLVIGTGAKTEALMKTVTVPTECRDEIVQISEKLKAAISDTNVDDELLLVAIARIGEEVISRLSSRDGEIDVSSLPSQVHAKSKGSKRWQH